MEEIGTNKDFWAYMGPRFAQHFQAPFGVSSKRTYLGESKNKVVKTRTHCSCLPEKENSEQNAFLDMTFMQGPVIPIDVVHLLTGEHPLKSRELFSYVFLLLR